VDQEQFFSSLLGSWKDCLNARDALKRNGIFELGLSPRSADVIVYGLINENSKLQIIKAAA